MRVNNPLVTHVRDRIQHSSTMIKVWSNSWWDLIDNILYFPLWNYSGQLVGYQQYRYDMPNHNSKNHPKLNKYYTHLPRHYIAVFGIEYNPPLWEIDTLYVTEGVFDCLSVMSLGYNCIATLCNNPQKIKSWLKTIPCTTIAICDGDKAGKELTKCCDYGIVLPEGEDANSLAKDELRGIINETYLEKHSISAK